MKQKFSKNFIAFTLSEMMIVLLIISVISAATLPAITSRNETEAGKVGGSTASVTVNSAWYSDDTYTKGYYYRNNGADTIITTRDISNYNAASKNNDNNLYGASPLRLWRYNLHSDCNLDGACSGIAFFNNDSQYSGRIVADGKSIIISDTKKSDYSNRFEYKIIIGSQAMKSATLLPGRSVNNNNIIVGANAGAESAFGDKNISIAPVSDNSFVVQNSVNIGQGAWAKTKAKAGSFTDSVNIGAYAGYSSMAIMNGVNIGYYASANSVNATNFSVFRAPVSIGAFSAYAAQTTRDTISVGYYAGALQTSTAAQDSPLQHNINLGAYAGYKARVGGNVNIGYHSGYKSTSNNIGQQYFVNIGQYAGSATSYDSTGAVNIGNYAGSEAGNFSVSIGQYAGYKASGNNNTVSIGQYAGWGLSSSSSNVVIGYYASGIESKLTESLIINSEEKSSSSTKYNAKQLIRIGCAQDNYVARNNDFSLCIGGQMPITSSFKANKYGGNTTVWGSGSTPTHTIMLIPGGIKAASSSAFQYTNILLYAKYVASLSSTMYTWSDKRLKENIKPTKYGIEKLKHICVYQFNLIGDKTPSIGVIAQELMKYYPNAVNKVPENIKKGGYLSVNADWIIYSLTQAIKDVDKMVTSLNTELAKNISDVVKLSERVNKVEVKLSSVEKSQKQNRQKLAEIDKMIAKMERK